MKYWNRSIIHSNIYYKDQELRYLQTLCIQGDLRMLQTQLCPHHFRCADDSWELMNFSH